jgi:hypothetical protein
VRFALALRFEPDVPAGRDALLHDVHLGADRDLLQRDRRLHLAGEVRVVEGVGVANALVRHQLEVRAAERVGLPVAEVGERHPVRAADLGVQLVHLAGEAVRRQPLDHGVGVEEGAIDALCRCAQDALEADGAGGRGPLGCRGGHGGGLLGVVWWMCG